MRKVTWLWPCLWLACIGCSGARDEQIRSLGRGDGGTDASASEDPERDAEAAPDEDAATDGGESQLDAAMTLDAAAVDAGADAMTADAVVVAADATAADAQSDAGPPRVQAYVNAATGDDQGPGTSSAPLKTLARAFAVVGANGLVLAQPSTFNPASEGLSGIEISTGRVVPAGAIVRATGPGVQLGVTLDFPAGGSVEGVTFDMTNAGRVLAKGGDITLREVHWMQSSTTGGAAFALELSGSARVTLEPGADVMHDYIAGGQAPPAFAMLRGQSELAVLGGVIDGASGAGFGNLIDVGEGAKLTLRNVTISNQAATWVSGGSVVWVGGTSSTVLIENSRIDLANAGGAACVVQDDNQAAVPGPFSTRLTIRNSVLTRCAGSALQLREDVAEVRIEGSELSGSATRFGIETGQIGFDSVKMVGRPRITIVDSIVRGNASGGITMTAGGSLSIQGGSISMNGGAPVGGGGSSGYGGLYLQGVFPYVVSLRGVRVADNFHFSNYAGIDLGGDAASSFDLGTLASVGGNTFAGNTAPQLRLRVAAGVRVDAVGNQWLADQGADAQGRYVVGSDLCAGPSPCDQTTGSGVNFAFTSAGAGASLRLAAQ